MVDGMTGGGVGGSPARPVNESSGVVMVDGTTGGGVGWFCAKALTPLAANAASISAKCRPVHGPETSNAFRRTRLPLIHETVPFISLRFDLHL